MARLLTSCLSLRGGGGAGSHGNAVVSKNLQVQLGRP